MKWFRIDGFQAHAGAGKCRAILLYIKARNIVHALERYQYVPSIKKNLKTCGRFPNIYEITAEEKENLEDKIEEDRKIKIKTRCWFYFVQNE